MREQYEPDPGGMQRQPTADARNDVHGRTTRNSLQINNIMPIEHSQLNMMVGDLVKILQERNGRLPQADSAWSERGDFPQP